MKKLLFVFFTLFICLSISEAQTCNNWLNTPSTPSFINAGQINITGNKITVEATFNRTAPYSGGLLYAGDLVSKHNTPADANYLLRPNEAEITTSNGYFRTPDICEIELNKTYHAAMVYDGTTLKFYRNGFLMSQTAATGDLFQNNWQTRIGWYEPQGFNTNFIGFINEVRIWNVAKTQIELNTYMNASLPTPTAQPGLVAYYTFDNLLNKQGNATYDGVLGGSASINQTNPNCIFVADSCATIPTSQCNFDFSYKQDACNPLAVQFFNIGDSPVNPYWSFGDGSIVSSLVNPSHVYASPGNYPVKYSVQNGGCTDTITKNISINITNQNIILTQDTIICFGTSKQLITAPSLGFCWLPTTYLSDPNNANPITNTPVPIIYYFTAEIPGNNLITNGDFNAGNTSFTSQYNFASPNITEGQYFVGANPQSWNASLSNCTDHTTGNGNMLLVNGAPAPDVAVWNQTVTITPNTNYAFATWIQALYIPNPAQLSFSINGGDVGTLITASLPTCTWSRFYTTWNSGNNTAASISIVNKNTLVQGNDFALDDISFSPILIKRDSVVIAIDHPVIKTNNDTLVCAGNKVQLTATGAATYNWLPGVGLSNAAISNPIATTINTMQYIVTGTSAKGCSASDTVNIITKPKPVLTKTADTVICKNNSLQLLATGGVSYQWFPINGLNNSSIPNPIATTINSTTYSVIVTGNNSCTSTDSVKVTVKPQPLFTISPVDTTCFNTAVQLNASGGDLYSWSPVALVSNPNIANPSTTGNANTTYTVLIKEFACNNSATLTTSITVLPIPTIKASKSNDINCSIGNAQLSVTGAGQYAWSPGGSLNNNAIANPIANPATTTLYFVTGTDFVTNCIAKDTVTVFVNKEGATTFFIPSAFSPDGDGVNDCFRVKHFAFLKSVDISIYNRYGSLVFHTTNDTDCWDGTYKGKKAVQGNYVYYIKAEDNCESFLKKGNLLLMR